ncbi:hypothetical protein YYC_02087 [Plasmodium yoelii 17X]|uniref:YIR protein n=1 Tax=Plasmodium yoelii 17X TaxID=1323249 RepID=V7PNK4_PLAYE|nr:hypothetical protein YYC_02087 [Plasmodium yoelii 17X]
MKDDICSNFVVLRNYLPDELDKPASREIEDITNFNKYCPENNCNTDLDKITIGFLWLLGEYFTKYPNSGNNAKPIFLYIILWLSYKLNQNKNHKFTKINDFYTNQVNASGKYSKFTSEAYKFTDIEKFLDEQNDLLNINIEELSKFYDTFKLLCSMYDTAGMNTDKNTLLNNANKFVIKYQELNRDSSNINDSSYRKILSALSTDYDHLKNKCKNVQPLPDIKANISALTSTFGDASSSSSIGSKLFTVLSIFGAIAFFLGISYKYSLFGFRKRAQKQYLRKKIKNIKKKLDR